MKHKVILALLLITVFIALPSFVLAADLTECGPVTEDSRVVNDIFYDDSDACFTIETDGITLDCQNKVLNGNGKGKGILIEDKSNVKIKNCKPIDFDYGLYLSGLNTPEEQRDFYNEFTNLYVKSNDIYGIFMISTNENTFTDLYIESNPKGIYSYDCDNNIFNFDYDVDEHNLYKNSDQGVILSYSSYNTITDIKAYGNGNGETTDAIIYLDTNSDNNTIKNNFFDDSNSGYEIKIKDSNYNKIYSNDFDKDTAVMDNHAEDGEDNSNKWYNPDESPYLGNIWFDYNAEDPAPEDTDGDGDGDTGTVPYPRKGFDYHPKLSCANQCEPGTAERTCNGNSIDIKECKKQINDCYAEEEKQVSCEVGCTDGYCDAIIDTGKPYMSKGYSRDGSGDYGEKAPFVEYDISGFEAPIYVSYKYMYYSNTKSFDATILMTASDDINADFNNENKFDFPKTGDKYERYDKSLYYQRDIKISENADKLTFDFKNGDYKIMIADIVVFDEKSYKDCTDDFIPQSGSESIDYPKCKGNTKSERVIMTDEGCYNYDNERDTTDCTINGYNGCNEDTGLCIPVEYTLEPDVQYTNIEDMKRISRYSDSTYRSREVAQSFVPTKSDLKRVSLYVRPSYMHDGDIPKATVQIQTNKNSKPSGNVVATSEEVLFSDLYERPTSFDIDTELEIGKTYWMVLKDDTTSKKEYVIWFKNSPTIEKYYYKPGKYFYKQVFNSKYSDGKAAYMSDGKWRYLSSYDRFFQTFAVNGEGRGSNR
jgi:parallel beta-helix repeat protein